MNPRRIGRPEAEWVDAVLDDEAVSNEEDGRSDDASGDRGERRRRGGAHGIAAVAMMTMQVRVERSATVSVARGDRGRRVHRIDRLERLDRLDCADHIGGLVGRMGLVGRSGRSGQVDRGDRIDRRDRADGVDTRTPAPSEASEAREVREAREARAEAAGRVCDADSLAALLRRLTADEPSDSFGLFCLTAQGAPICWHLIARGAFDHGALRRAEVFRAAIASDAAGIVLTQARPVGRPLPMPEDLNLTAELVILGQQLDIPVIDHIVLGPRSHASLRRICAALFPTN